MYPTSISVWTPTDPFVGINEPFVFLNSTYQLPNIGKNIPSVLNQSESAGFTLIELMVTLVIAAVLIGLSAPGMSQIVASHRLSGQVNDFLADLNFARSEAVKRGTTVGVCSGNATSGCTGAWNAGRIVFFDVNGNNAWDSGDTVLRGRQAIYTNSTITSTGTLIVFSGSGALALDGAGNRIGKAFYVFCYNNVPARGKQVSVGDMGQSSTLSAAPNAC
ncbi:MAG: GspH/FimT family pseudopilin [Gammaproteobacteria bacterium]|nr:GspH/FimT family pseudopilin [Gammaproteobacteria bacterium]